MHGKTQQHAIIIGGGVAGLTTALAFQRAGIEAVVYEASDPPSPFKGSFLTLAMNGVTALRSMEAFAPIERQGFWMASMDVMSGAGKRFGKVPGSGSGLFIERTTLVTALWHEAQRRGIRCETGKRLLDIHPTSGGVSAHFADGTSVSGDLLVGADGMHSRVRTLVDPTAPRPRYVSLLGLGGATQLPARSTAPTIFTLVLGKRAFFGWVPSPEGTVYWFANVPVTPEPARQQLETVTPQQWRDQLTRLFAEDATPAVDLIRSTATYDGFRPTILHILPPLPHWSRASMVLVGDAAHGTSPTSGQGASLAMEDSLMLAKCLRDCADLSHACAVYEGLRRVRVEQVAKVTGRADQFKIAGSLLRRVRDLVMPFALHHLVPPTSDSWRDQGISDWEAPLSTDLTGAKIQKRGKIMP